MEVKGLTRDFDHALTKVDHKLIIRDCWLGFLGDDPG
jgi:hypothetical protein